MLLFGCSRDSSDGSALNSSAPDDDPLSPELNKWGTPSVCVSAARSNGGTIVLCPGGDGTSLADVGATITITMVSETGAAVDGVPAGAFYVQGVGIDSGLECRWSSETHPGWVPLAATGPTGYDGKTTITRAFPGMMGGFFHHLLIAFEWDGVLHKFCAAYPAQFCCGQTPLQLPIAGRSVDLNDDGRVSLQDLAIFSTHYSPNPYDPTCDFNNDGAVSLADFAIFSTHYNHSCW